MPIRYHDATSEIVLSVRDLAEVPRGSGDLVLDVVQSRAARAAAGRDVHAAEQAARAAEMAGYTPEVSLSHRLDVDGWWVTVQGRVDGLFDEAGHTVVEEIKSTALGADRLHATRAADWPGHVAQLELYVWLLHATRGTTPGTLPVVGRLLLVSLLDGARHVLAVRPDTEALAEAVVARLRRLVRKRRERLAWLGWRRAHRVPRPFATWRDGQARIAEAVHEGLAAGKRVLVEAPTGLGKTAAVLDGALRWAFAHDKQLFWATSRNTQQAGVLAAAGRLRARGLGLTAVGLRAREKACLNDVVACRADACRFAARYHDKVEAAGLIARAMAEGGLDGDSAMALGAEAEVCPVELLQDVAERADLVVGDANFALLPGRAGRLLSEDPGAWGVIGDEAHHLVERARSHGSPALRAGDARRAAAWLAARDPSFHPFVEVCEGVERAVLDTVRRTPGPLTAGTGVADLPAKPFRALADRVDELAWDYALLKASTRPPGEKADSPDPWRDLAREVLRFAAAVDTAGEETVALADCDPGEEAVRLYCVDPSGLLREAISPLGGFVGASATLSPAAFFQRELGLPEGDAVRRVEVGNPFPPERRPVIVAPRVSTRFRDREAHAPRTAALIAALAAATPGNTAFFCPSFAMLRDLAARLSLPGHRALIQPPALAEADRGPFLAPLTDGGDRVLLGAVLGGLFAEGVDLPAGALATLIVVGPALPPIGLERDLLADHHARAWDDPAAGYRFASLVPGMTKVVQAAGRLVRRPEDRGVVVLVGARFRHREVAALLPRDWALHLPDDPVAAVASFHAGNAVDAPWTPPGAVAASPASAPPAL